MERGKVIDIGAEAVIIKNNSKIIKRRIKKGYRHSKIDEKLRKKRTRWEARNIERVSKEINVPKISEVNENKKEMEMEFIGGKRLSEILNKFKINKQKKTVKEIGKDVGKMHDLNIIHGDLTTSNIILNKDKITFIDFGLSFHSMRVEDKAVDLHLLKQALEAKHFKTWKILWKVIKTNYNPEDKDKILKRLDKVEGRGRYK